MARECCGDTPAESPKRKEAAGITIFLAGNPNSGKTTLFNRLTGARQRTGNWPGVTVEGLEGFCRDAVGEMRVIDLPGVYSLNAGGQGDDGAALDEAIARHAITTEPHDVIVNIVDASNLERNLFLTVQLMEARRPMVLALNMTDVAEGQGDAVDARRLRQVLGIPVVPINARRGEGVEELRAAIRQAAQTRSIPAAKPPWPAAVAAVLAELLPLTGDTAARHGIDTEWLLVRALEGDDQARALLPEDLRAKLEERAAKLEAALGEDIDLVLADARYRLANELARAALAQRAEAALATISDRVDAVVLNRFAGPLIFFAAMYLLFMLTINVGGAFVDFFDILFGAVFVDGARALLTSIGAPAWLIALLADGIGAGIQTVSTFIPVIGFLYLGLTFLEDSGYMARAAFVADRAMRAIGLPGKAFVPLIVGFGCNVPAVMATRTLENPRDRIATMIMAPFMSCGARLTVFALFAAAFFGAGGQNVVFALYLVGIAAAVLTGLLLKRTLLQGANLPFIMELPPYRLPGLADLLAHAWLRLKGFLFGAGKVIVLVVGLLGVLNSLGTDGSFGNQHGEKSVLTVIGKTFTPAFAPLGIREDNWPATVGLFTGVFAKEVVVGALNALYAGMDEPAVEAAERPFDLMAGVREAFATIPANLVALKDSLLDPLGLSAAGGDVKKVAQAQGVEAATIGAMVRHFDGRAGAFAYMLFVLLYFPCVAVFGAITREAGLRWALFAGLWSTSVAWVSATSFYQAATFAAHPATSALWIGLNIAGMTVVLLLVRHLGRRGVMPVAGQPLKAG